MYEQAIVESQYRDILESPGIFDFGGDIDDEDQLIDFGTKSEISSVH